jgi:hypothetical protein
MHTIFDRRSARDAERFREIVCQVFDDDRVATERKVRPVLLGRAHGDDERGTQP